MRSHRLLFPAAIVCGLVCAQEPQTDLRSVVNGVNFQSAPADVAIGGILAVFGTNLAGEVTRAEALPLPMSLEEPAVQVLVNGVPCPLYFVSPKQISAQVPWEAELGPATVVVQRGGVESTPMPVIVRATQPNLFTHSESNSLIVKTGFASSATVAGGPSLFSEGGPASALAANGNGDIASAAATFSAGDSLVAYAAGLGATEPPAANGAGGATESPMAPTATQLAYIGGMPASINSVGLVSDAAGVYELVFDFPESAKSGDVLNWISGPNRSAALVGSAGDEPTPQFMDVPADVGFVNRIDMTDLNPYFVAVSGTADETDFCYRNVQLLDFRRQQTTGIADCLLPSDPQAANPLQLWPFEISTNSARLAALTEPLARPGDGITNRLVVIDSVEGSVVPVDLPRGADRLQFGPTGSRGFRLWRPGETGLQYIYDPDSGEFGDEIQGWAPLPDPLEVDGLRRVVAQGVTLPGGYRFRFLGPGIGEAGEPISVVFDATAQIVAKTPFPDGWAPVAVPRRRNNQGVEVGNALAAATGGFPGDSTVYVASRSSDGSRDAVVAFRAEVPADSPQPPPASIPVSAVVTEFPSGVFAASCDPLVRWQRLALSRRLALVVTGEQRTEYAAAQENQVCGGDQLLMFDTRTREITTVPAPGPLDNAAKGGVRDYLYFAGAERPVALEAPTKLYVFDGVTDTFQEVGFPEGVGITINAANQTLPGQARLVALATGGPPRTNNSGRLVPPFPGNRGLLVVDLPAGEASFLALPEGSGRIFPGRGLLVQQGRRGYGLIPILGRAFARVQRQGRRTDMMIWDVATGEPFRVPMPDGGFSVVAARPGGNALENPEIWDFKPKAGAFAFGVFNRDGDLFSIGVLGP